MFMLNGIHLLQSKGKIALLLCFINGDELLVISWSGDELFTFLTPLLLLLLLFLVLVAMAMVILLLPLSFAFPCWAWCFSFIRCRSNRFSFCSCFPREMGCTVPENAVSNSSTTSGFFLSLYSLSSSTTTTTWFWWFSFNLWKALCFSLPPCLLMTSSVFIFSRSPLMAANSFCNSSALIS